VPNDAEIPIHDAKALLESRGATGKHLTEFLLNQLCIPACLNMALSIEILGLVGEQQWLLSDSGRRLE
jgi:hypothetical protein